MTDVCVKKGILTEVPADFSGYYVAALTDEYRVGKWPEEDSFDIEKAQNKLLELRIFNEKAEYKWFRGNIGESFLYRKLADRDETSACYEEPIEEYQILDIDMSQMTPATLPGRVKMSIGGSFYLPLYDEKGREFEPCVRIKYYLPKYEQKEAPVIHSYVKDWRLAGFEWCMPKAGGTE